MSEIKYCPIGGQPGIFVSSSELNELANVLNTQYADEFIPLPGVETAKQEKMISACVEHSSAQYWETPTGSHGWCCDKCGYVIQWG